MADDMTLSTAPTSKRFPTTNQAKACYMYYNSWHQCKYDYSDEEPQCAKLKGWAMSMCPIEWVRRPLPHSIIHCRLLMNRGPPGCWPPPAELSAPYDRQIRAALRLPHWAPRPALGRERADQSLWGIAGCRPPLLQRTRLTPRAARLSRYLASAVSV